MPTPEEEWEYWFEIGWWLILCHELGREAGPPPPPPMIHTLALLDVPTPLDGKRAYRGTNLQRYDQGFPLTDLPPADSYYPDGDFVTVDEDAKTATLTTFSPPVTEGLYWFIYGRPCNTRPADISSQYRKRKFILHQEIEPSIAYDLSPILTPQYGFYSGCFAQLEFRIGARGSVARAVSFGGLYV